MSMPRRALPGLLAGATVALAGCDLLPTSAPAPVPSPSADELLVDSVAAAVLAARDQAASLPGGWPYTALHEAHLTALGRPVTSALATTPTASPTPTPAELLTTENALQTTLLEGAVAAGDGGLARLMASMSAAVAQLLNASL